MSLGGRRWRTRLPAVAAAATTLAVTLAGCVSIPESSSVSEGRAADVQDEPRVISNIPAGPRPGAAPADIVSGYFAAMLAYPQTDEVAREFLTPIAARDWSPRASVVVYDDQSIVDRGAFVDVRARSLGSLDARGSWTTTDPARARVRVPVRLTKVEGEWRIVNPLPGLYVDRDYFLRSYAQFSLYYFDPTGLVLTPDPVYLLIGDETATELVENLLLGPTAGLLGIVESAAPLGTELVEPVQVSPTGTATIPLSESVTELDDTEQQLFAAQLTWTLRQLPDIDEIAVTVEGERLDIAGVGTRIDIDEFAGYDPAGLAASRQLFALDPGGLVSLDDSGVVQVSGPIRDVSAGSRSVGVDPTGAVGAVVSADGATLTVAGVNPGSTRGPQVWLADAENLMRPSWDVHQVLWAVERGAEGAVIHAMTGPSGDRVLDTRGLSGEEIQGFAVSRDGVRFAAVVADGDVARLVIAKIDRPAAAPGEVSLPRLTEVISPDVTLTGISGLAWASPTRVVLLADGEGGDRQLLQVSIDGSIVESATGFLPSQPLTVAAGPNIDAPTAIGARDGNVYVQTPDLQWAEVPSQRRLYAPTYPG